MSDTETIATRPVPENPSAGFEPVAVDYFDTDETFQYVLPDGVSYVEHKLLNEGDRQRYLSQTTREMRVHRGTQDMYFNPGAGEDRKALLLVAVVGWNLKRKAKKGGNLEPVPFNTNELTKFVMNASPTVLEKIEDDIRKKNPWLTAEVSVEDIDREIERLTELREEKIKEQEGNAGLSV